MFRLLIGARNDQREEWSARGMVSVRNDGILLYSLHDPLHPMAENDFPDPCDGSPFLDDAEYRLRNLQSHRLNTKQASDYKR